MSVAKISEISATSTKSFEDALAQGIARANKTLRNVRGGWIKEQQVRVTQGAITECNSAALRIFGDVTTAQGMRGQHVIGLQLAPEGILHKRAAEWLGRLQ